jgi:hypothetical protein
MLGLLVAIRNFTIALVLAWMGFSVAPDSDKDNETRTVAPASGAVSLITG